MTMRTWQRDTLSYDLSDGYSLMKSEPLEWGVHFSVYYNMAYNGFWKNGGYDMPSDKAYMIYHNNVRIGGVCIAPNVIYHLFFIPPFSQKHEVLGLLKELLLSWSDPTKPIRAIEILPDQIDMYSMFGFQPNEFRNRWMQRPTAKFEVEWDTHVNVKTPKFDPSSAGKKLIQENELNRLFYLAYTQGIEDIRRHRNTEEDHREACQFASETNESLLEASTLVYDKQSNQLIGACLISLQGGIPAVFNIAVLPTHRRGGLASKMLKYALNVLKSDYPILRLYVMQGNEAELVYHNLGFQPGLLEVQHCSIPASVSDVTD
ncbi:GNAT family N-acetyltransferase [Ornithinibacillus californiensis]|uniref:GNAT family N-acetyltransferase n=1 Tax=Ornithinibacillus californiensis TaxID=161536 RepID=UPI00064D72C5|nr:GNAT family N-acetyltransferase [Ornithinibacillus californiensis]